MSKEKLEAAKQFIQEKQYREARIILKSTNHPKANEWLAKLPKSTQAEKTKNTPQQSFTNSPAFAIIAIFVLFVTFVSGVFVGQILLKNASASSLDLTRTAIHNANKTTEAHIRATYSVATENALQTQVVATQTQSGTQSVNSPNQETIAPTPSRIDDPAFPTWTPTPN